MMIFIAYIGRMKVNGHWFGVTNNETDTSFF